MKPTKPHTPKALLVISAVALVLSFTFHVSLWRLRLASSPRLSSPPIPVVTWNDTPLTRISPSRQRPAKEEGKTVFRDSSAEKPSHADGLSLKSLTATGPGMDRVPEPTASDERGTSFQLGELRHSVVYQHVYDAIDHVLVYPEELRVNHIGGTVKATLFFSAQGKLQRKQTQVESLSPYLRVLVWRVLRSAFADGIPERYLQGNPLTVRCLFLLAVGNDGGEQAPIMGKLLSFRRGANSGTWRLGPLAGAWGAPAIAVDPEWFVQQAKDAFTNRIPPDPLASYRRDPEWK